jgi:hypothetical protein
MSKKKPGNSVEIRGIAVLINRDRSNSFKAS